MRHTFFLLITFFIFSNLSAQNYQLLDTKQNVTGIEILTLCPDGNTMLVGDLNGYVSVWDLPTMTMTSKVRAHNGQLSSIIFNPKGNWYVTAGWDKKVKLWAYPSNKLINSYTSPHQYVNFAAASPDGQYIYFGGMSSSGSRVLSYNSNEPYACLYRVSLDGSGRIDRVYEDKEISLYTGSTPNITDGNIDYSHKYAVFSQGKNLNFWDLTTDRLAYKITCPYNVNNFTTTRGGIYAWGDGRIMKYIKSDTKYIMAKTVVAGDIRMEQGYSHIKFSSDDTRFLSGNDGNDVILWNTTTMTREQVLKGHRDVARDFIFWKNDSVIITGSYDGTIKIWGYPKKEEPVVKDTVQVVHAVKDTVRTVVLPKDTVKENVVVFKENNVPVTIKDRPVELQGEFVVKTEEFEIEVWDNSAYDHDIISLNINGEWVLQNYEVTKEKKTIRLKVKKEENNYLILYAHNLGDIPPNTAAIALNINGKLQRFSVKSDLSKCGALNFNYKP